MPSRNPKPTAKAKQTRRLPLPSAAELKTILQVGLEAATTGSQDRSNMRRRIDAAIRRHCDEIGVSTPELTPRILKHLDAVAKGHKTMRPPTEGLATREELKQALEQQSDFLELAEPSRHWRAKHRKLDEDNPPLRPSATAKRNRDPNNPHGGKRDTPPPIGLNKGKHMATAEEADLRVTEIVQRLGLGATRQQIQEWARKSWSSGYSDRQVDEYLRAARAILRSNWAREREDFMLDLLEQYQRLASDARVQDQLGTALGCLNSMARLTNLGGFAAGHGQ